jgi:hypothetical protein
MVKIAFTLINKNSAYAIENVVVLLKRGDHNIWNCH